ncbi:MAG: hypothetical protein SV201_14895 [Pseudomonadota bacterium]|nr:hypothetical protein [Pseudomonadota bacterium]
MYTNINFKALEDKPKAERLKMLSGAVARELQLPAMALDMAKQYSALAGVKKAGFDSEAIKAPGDEQIKAFLGRKYGTPSDTPELVDPANQFAEFFHTNMPEMDMGYALLFGMNDLRNSVHDHFDIMDTNMGITWTQRAPGELTKIKRNISESKTTVSLLEFTAGVGILDRWIERQMWWNVDEAIAEFRANHFDKKASFHYALITALGAGIDVAFDTDDVTTANKAAAAIIRACKGKGYGIGNNPTFYAVTAPEQVGRLEKMLTAQRGSAIVNQGTVDQPLAHRISGIIGTTEVESDDTGWYLVLPGRKVKRGEFKDLTVESDRNIYASAEDIVGVAQYNAAIGDSDQVRRCKFSA